MTDDEFKTLFAKIAKPQNVIGYSKEDSDKWNEGYTFAFSLVYDVLVVNGGDEV